MAASLDVGYQLLNPLQSSEHRFTRIANIGSLAHWQAFFFCKFELILSTIQLQISNSRLMNDRYGTKMDTTRDLASLYQICKEHLTELQALSNKEVTYYAFILNCVSRSGEFDSRVRPFRHNAVIFYG